MTRQILACAILLLVFLGAGSCSSLVIDKAVSAVDGNDYTIILGGFGQIASKGYLFAQLREGQDGTGLVSLYFPATQCKRESCVSYQTFHPDGSYGPAGAIPAGSGKDSMPLSLLVGHDGPITRNDEGEYGVKARIFLTGPDGIEYSALAVGFIRLNVLRADYRPLACNDPARGWVNQVDKQCTAEFSTAMRSAVCGRCQ